MNYLSQIFEHPLSTHVFIIGNALFAGLAIGVVAFIRADTQSNRSRFAKPRLMAATIGALVMVAALVGGLKLAGGASGGDMPRQSSISVNALMQQIDVRSLPVQEVGSFF
jgi:flagellar biosynthesis protein FliQ